MRMQKIFGCRSGSGYKTFMDADSEMNARDVWIRMQMRNRKQIRKQMQVIYGSKFARGCKRFVDGVDDAEVDA